MNTLALNWPTAALHDAIAPIWAGVCVDVQPRLPSTNTELMERARLRHVPPTLLVAECQSAGRGRMGRQWHSAQQAGAALTFSLGLPLAADCVLDGLSLVAGLAVAQALDAQGQHALRIKWPNDLCYRNRKLGGILIETCMADAVRYVVIGLGLNLEAPAPLPPQDGAAPHALAPAWLREMQPQAAAPTVLQQIAAPLALALWRFAHDGFAPWQARFAARDALAGRSVQASGGRSGTACGVDARGALLLRQSDGQCIAIDSDAVSVRPDHM